MGSIRVTSVAAAFLLELLGLSAATHVLVEAQEGNAPLLGDDLVEVVHRSQ